MAACVEYRQEDVSSAETNEKDDGDDLSLFGDFSGANMNHDLLQQSNQIQFTLDSESENPLIPETKSIMLGQDLGADDLLNSDNSKDYDWVLSPPRNPVHSLEMDEHTTLTDLILISNDQSTSPQSKLETPPADCTSTSNVAAKLPTSFSNGVKSLNGAIRPSRKAPLTAKPMRSSTPTSRATVTAATKPVAPIKRSTTPTSRPSIHPVAKSASRSSTPTKQPFIIAAVKSASRSSTPIQRPSVLSASKSTSRSSTSTPRPSIIAAVKSASRSSTPTTRPSNPSGSLTTSVNGNRSSSALKSHGSSPSVKNRPSKNPPEMPERSAVKLPVTETNLKAVPKRTSCSPSRRLVSNGGGNNSVKSGITRCHGYSNGNDDDDVNPVLMGTKMVERVVNMRKLAPPRQDHISNQNNTSGKLSVSQENPGFGRSLSKKSFDMAMRHLDIRRSMPGNMRAMITKVPASTVYSVRPESTKSRTISTSDSPLATSSSENGHSYDQ
ncbi:hypothetical protein L1987_20629 [Smallanthus sonchifolius]|uniref:Uncharacterized protein n=1 Tax=Smallanthus sonchifolius TaxID=185202 RepID=A0ACB9ISE1_9ASTR|nr:hypothetical protein L1987_20629 [Smallanthus sonchifolius]